MDTGYLDSIRIGAGGGVRTPRVVEIEGYILRLYPFFFSFSPVWVRTEHPESFKLTKIMINHLLG